MLGTSRTTTHDYMWSRRLPFKRLLTCQIQVETPVSALGSLLENQVAEFSSSIPAAKKAKTSPLRPLSEERKRCFD